MNADKRKKLSREAYVITKKLLETIQNAGSGHIGGSMSIAEILSVLYFEEMNIDPADPKKADRDRFVLSKGHTAPGLYSVLAQRGYFPVEDLKTLRHIGSYLQGHPDMKHIPGVDMSSGSLGQGISAAVGMALSAKLSMMTIVFIHYWVMVRSRKARFGRLPCLPATVSWTTW